MVQKSTEMQRFEKDLAADGELRKKLDEAAKKAVDSGECTCDGDVLIRAANSLGYEISLGEVERMQAGMEELDPEELEKVSGGSDSACFPMVIATEEDEHGHDSMCLTAWHCLAATLHTETESKRVNCWSDYLCVIVNIEDQGY